jgi:osmotically-inducible protein OsmY
MGGIVRIITSVVLSLFVVGAAACGRSDKAIEAGVKARLAADPVVHSRQIDVDSRKGTVTLSGRVDTREERQHAMQVATSTEGVLRVIDHLEVASAFDQTAPSQAPDRTH